MRRCSHSPVLHAGLYKHGYQDDDMGAVVAVVCRTVLCCWHSKGTQSGYSNKEFQ